MARLIVFLRNQTGSTRLRRQAFNILKFEAQAGAELRASRKDTGSTAQKRINALASARYNHRARNCKLLKNIISATAARSQMNRARFVSMTRQNASRCNRQAPIPGNQGAGCATGFALALADA
jgi:hypothetical protein